MWEPQRRVKVFEGSVKKNFVSVVDAACCLNGSTAALRHKSYPLLSCEPLNSGVVVGR